MAPMAKKSSPRDGKRQPVLSIDRFARRNYHTIAWQKCKDKKEKKRLETSKALRKYKKTKKQQGYDREIVNGDRLSPQENNNDTNDTAVAQTNNKKSNKSNAFNRALELTEKKRQEREQRQREREQNEAQRQAKLKQRQERTALLKQRTRKGQPIMKNMVTDILHKLQSK